LVTLLADSFLPTEWVGDDLIRGKLDADSVLHLKSLALPAQAWLSSCVSELVKSAKPWSELSQALHYLGSDPEPSALYQDAYVIAQAVVETDFGVWAQEVLVDALANRVMDATDDYELADTATDQIEEWNFDVVFKMLREKFVQLAKAQEANEHGQTVEQVLVSAGFLGQAE
jgi:hypothetical protein